MCTTAASASDGEVFIGCALLQLQIPKVGGAAIRFKSMERSLKSFFGVLFKGALLQVVIDSGLRSHVERRWLF